MEKSAAVVTDNGAHLQVDDVSVSFKPGSFPVGTTVTAMLQKLENGFVVRDGTKLSSIVTIGPHHEQKLQEPVTIRVPIRDRDAVFRRVLVSHTPCRDNFLWDEVPADQIRLSSDHRYVEISLYQFSVLCLQEKHNRAAPVIILANRHLNVYVYALKERSRRRGCTLCVEFSSFEAFKQKTEMEYQLIASDRIDRHIPIGSMTATLKGMVDSLWQSSSPFHPSWTEGQLLAEQFSVKIKPVSGSDDQSGGHESQRQFWNEEWSVKPASEDVTESRGCLSIEYDDSDSTGEDGDKKPQTFLHNVGFKFTWSDPEVRPAHSAGKNAF